MVMIKNAFLAQLLSVVQLIARHGTRLKVTRHQPAGCSPHPPVLTQIITLHYFQELLDQWIFGYYWCQVVEMGRGAKSMWPLYLGRYFVLAPLPKIATVIVPLSLNWHHQPSALCSTELSFSLTAEFLKFLIKKTNLWVGQECENIISRLQIKHLLKITIFRRLAWWIMGVLYKHS